MNDTPRSDTVDPALRSPFKFLDYYAEGDRANFAGRDNDIREVLSGILRGRVFVVYGRSGIGKTSLLNAGVLPLLRQRGYSPVYVRVLESPTGDLLRTLSATFPEYVSDADSGIRALLRNASTDQRPIVIVLDQFEEFFIRFREDRRLREDFIETLGTLLRDATLDVRIVFSLREDYLAEMDDFRDSLPGVATNRFRLSPLSAFGTRQAIAQPLVNSEIAYDQRLLSRLVDLLADMDFDTPLLQIICTEVYREAWRRDPDDLRLSIDDLAQVGGLEGIFRRYLDSALASIAPDDHLLARLVLDRLITVERTKAAVNLDGFLRGDFVAEPEEVERVLGLLVEHRLVRAENRGDETWYELLHERLVDIILNWLQLDQDYFNYRVARDLIANSSRGERWREVPEALLTRGQIDDVAGPFRTRLRLGEHELEFMLRSAIFRHSAHVDYWAGRFGGTESASLLLLMSKSDADEVRVGAAASIGQLQQRNAQLLDACYELAVGDSSQAVRREAGKSFARHAEEDDLRVVDESLSAPARRSEALEIVADLHTAGHALGRFSWLVRRRGRRIADQRVYREHAEAIRMRAKTGALLGLLGGLAWTGTVAGVYQVLIAWQLLVLSNDMPIVLGIFGALTLVVALALGTLFGWQTASRGARDAVLAGEGHWFRATWGSFGVWLLLALAASFWWGVLIEEVGPLRKLLRSLIADELYRISAWFGASAVCGLLTATVVQFLVAALVRGFRDSIVTARRAATAWLWCAVAAAGLPFLLPGLAFALFAESPGAFSDRDIVPLTWFAAVFLAPIVSLLVFVACLGLVRGVQQQPQDDIALRLARRAWPWRGASVAALVCLLGWYQTWYGFQHSPLWPIEYVLAECNESESHIKADLSFDGTWPPQSRYLRARSQQARHVSITSSGSGRMRIHTAHGRRMSRGTPLIMPADSHVDITVSGSTRTRGPRPAHVRITGQCLATGDSIDILPGRKNVHLVQLERSGDEVWSATLSGTAPPNSRLVAALPVPTRRERDGLLHVRAPGPPHRADEPAATAEPTEQLEPAREWGPFSYFRWEHPQRLEDAFGVQADQEGRWHILFTLRGAEDALRGSRLHKDQVLLPLEIKIRR